MIRFLESVFAVRVQPLQVNLLESLPIRDDRPFLQRIRAQ